LRGGLPFCLSRQARACPAGIGIGFIKADMGNRSGRVDRAPAVQPEAGPTAIALFPVKGRGDGVRLHPAPAIRQPVARIAIAAIGDEGGPFAVGHRPVSNGVGAEQRLVARPFCIKGKAIADMADVDDPAGMRDPTDRPRHRDRHFARRWPDRGFGRVLREQMQDVGDQQFLMLLFMMAAKFHQIERCAGERRQCGEQRCVNGRAIAKHLGQGRPGDHAAPGAGMAFALCLIIAVEQEREARVMQLIAGNEIAQNEGFEKPAGMRQMPFGRGGVVHRLHAGIGIGKRRDQRHTQRPYRLIPFRKLSRICNQTGLGLHCRSSA